MTTKEVVSGRVLSHDGEVVMELTMSDGEVKIVTMTMDQARALGKRFRAGADLAEQGKTPIIRLDDSEREIGPNEVDLGRVDITRWKSRSKKRKR